MTQKKGSRVSEPAEEVQVHVPLQAILLADSFAQKFRPITLERPKDNIQLSKSGKMLCKLGFEAWFRVFGRELSKKGQKANNIWWRLSGLLGDQNRVLMYSLIQAAFTVATMALTVAVFLSYEMHLNLQTLKFSAAVWNGGSFLLEVMPRQVVLPPAESDQAAAGNGSSENIPTAWVNHHQQSTYTSNGM